MTKRIRLPRFTAPRDRRPIRDELVADRLDALEWEGLVDRTRTATRVEHRLPESAWRVAMILLTWHQGGQEIYPSIAALVRRDQAAGHRTSRATVDRALRALREMGLLTIVPQYVLVAGRPRRTSSLYVLTLPAGRLRPRGIPGRRAGYVRHFDVGGLHGGVPIPRTTTAALPPGCFLTDAAAMANRDRQLALLMRVKGLQEQEWAD